MYVYMCVSQNHAGACRLPDNVPKLALAPEYPANLLKLRCDAREPATAAAAVPFVPTSPVASGSTVLVKPEIVQAAPSAQPTRMQTSAGNENAPPPPSSHSVPLENSRVKSEPVETAPMSGSDSVLNGTVAPMLMQHVASDYHTSEQGASPRDPTAGNVATGEQEVSVPGPVSPTDVPAPQGNEPPQIMSISPVGRVENASQLNESQKKQRSRKRRRRAREALVELQELKVRKLTLENLKLELDLGLITREECTERGAAWSRRSGERVNGWKNNVWYLDSASRIECAVRQRCYTFMWI